MRQDSLNVFGIGKRNALLELLKAECNDANISLNGYDASPYCPAANAVQPNFFVVPPAKSSEYLMSVENLLQEHQSIGHFSIIDPEIPVLGQLERKGVLSSQLLNSTYSTAIICEDKFLLFKTLNDFGIGVISTSTSPEFNYPYIFKDRFGSGASGFSVIHSEDVVRVAKGGDLIYQPYCTGEHYCVDAYFSIWTGKLIDLCAKEVLYKSNGESYTLRSQSPGEFINLLNQVAAVLPLRSIVNFDVYRHEDGLVVMDINCRIGGNYPASHLFGCNLLKPMITELISKSPVLPSHTSYLENKTISKYLAFTSL
ncbi:ATP-grasp domain-containing protein [Polynucleobacter sp. MG-28-Ekke-A2]|uniref:ATP-grasp domain-containing protein n=1 Tax=Polynucleobacter sp. MG-28-Ekke-A2 TaxID=3108276 RepID=UPI002B230743|nr:ATP-grasp domain-containing protein [Polynucleobacter sp. MG-28-Ekke-A2]MEA9601205.1 ATP-grasp domain-containing protein [Polynucleobacter sp. MG-28-Ekke-A2]